MHILIGFIIGVALMAGFHQIHIHPDDHTYVIIDAEQHLRVNTYMTSAQELRRRHVIMQQFDYSCGSAALATLLNYHLGERFTEMQVVTGLMSYGNLERIRQSRAFSMLDMKRFVEALGYQGDGYRARIENLRELDVPVILPIELFGYQHFVVFRGIHGNRIFLADPWLGNTSYTLNAFEDMWYREVIFMIDTKERPTRSLLRLTNEDMRYIQEDIVRWTLFPFDPFHMQFAPTREDRYFDPDLHFYKR